MAHKPIWTIGKCKVFERVPKVVSKGPETTNTTAIVGNKILIPIFKNIPRLCEGYFLWFILYCITHLTVPSSNLFIKSGRYG